MGYYIQCKDGRLLDKAGYLVEECGGQKIPCPKSFSEVPEDKGLICVVSNGPFEACAYCFNEREFIDFNQPSDRR